MEEQSPNSSNEHKETQNPVDGGNGENTPNPENKFKKLIFLGILAVALVFFFYADGTKEHKDDAKKEEKQEESKAILKSSLSYVEGPVEYKSPDGEWKRASKDIELGEGFSVEILGTGKAIIAFEDGSIVRLNSNTDVTLTNSKEDNILVTLGEGDMYARVVNNKERKFAVTFDKYTFESLGTAYEVFNEKTVKGIKALHNNVKLLGAGDKEILVQESNKYYIKKDSNKKLEKRLLKVTEKEIKNDGFLMWNKAEDEAKEKFKDEMGVLELEKKATQTKKTTTQKKKTTANNSFSLKGSAVTGGVNLVWTVPSYLDVSKGYKVVRSEKINPVYPGSDYQYISNQTTKSFKWPLTNGKTYYFRVCQYKGGYCGAYSNNVKVTAPKQEDKIDKPVTKIHLKSSGTNSVSWATSGYSEKGFKVVWSKSTYPTYPTRKAIDKYKYLSNPNSSSAELYAFDGSGDYYVRVCEYKFGICGVYSNQITVGLK